MTESTNPIVKCPCNVCGHETDHEIVWQHTQYGGPHVIVKMRTLFRIVCCRGCKALAIREESWLFLEGLGDGQSPNTVIKYRPPRLWRKPPSWLQSLEEIDQDLKGLLDEVYAACNNEQTRLLSMGVRSALDHVMTLILGGDVGTFEQKLDRMVEEKHLTKNQRENIAIVIDAGSASSHRGYRPPPALIEEMVVVVENIVRENYITGPMLRTAKQKIPPRPPRRPASTA